MADIGDLLTIGATGHQEFAPAAAIVAGVQTISLLGPFPVAFDSLGVDGTAGAPQTYANGGYVTLGTIPAGAVVIVAWPVVSTSFVTGAAAAVPMSMNIQPLDDPDNSSSLNTWTAQADTTAPTAFQTSHRSNAGDTLAGAISECQLMVTKASGSTPVAGEADIYALIATPS